MCEAPPSQITATTEGKERLKGKPDAALSSSPEWANRQGRTTKTWNSLCVYVKSEA